MYNWPVNGRIFALLLIAYLGTTVASASRNQQSQPGSPASENRKSLSHLARGRQLGAGRDWVGAEKEFRLARNQDPESAEAIVLHAESLVRLSQPFDAALELQGYIQKHPDSIQALNAHAMLEESLLQDREQAAADFESVVQQDPDNFVAWGSLGEIYLDDANVDDAIRCFSQALRIRPTDITTLSLLAYAEGQKDPSESVDSQFEQAIALNERLKAPLPGVYLMYAKYLRENGKQQESVKVFSKALMIQPNGVEALTGRARAYEELGDLAAAEKDAHAALVLAPGNKEAATLLVRVYRKEGSVAKAQEYAERVEKMSEQQERHFSTGRVLEENLRQATPLLLQGQYGEAAPHYEAIVATLPTFYEAYFDLGMCYSQMGEFEKAEVDFKRYLSYQPISADGHASLGILYLNQHREAEAVRELEEAVQIDPSLTEARKLLGAHYLKQGNPARAILVLRPAELSGDADVVVSLATAFEAEHQYSDALREVNRGLVADPGNLELQDLKSHLTTKSAQPGKSSKQP
jgi:tetratricopeptide (TPR) repeat protein